MASCSPRTWHHQPHDHEIAIILSAFITIMKVITLLSVGSESISIMKIIIRFITSSTLSVARLSSATDDDDAERVPLALLLVHTGK